jgi:hypothetical protein
MSAKPIVTFRSSVAAPADPASIYALLADLRSHLVWSGERAPDRNFRLLSLNAPAREATVGDRFSSTGSNILSMRFFDTSVVVDAQPGKSFGFETESRLQRKHRPAWHARFVHRYELAPDGEGTTISYACEVWPQNYVPWWLSPLMRPMTRMGVLRAIGRNMANLAAMAGTEAASAPQGRA